MLRLNSWELLFGLLAPVPSLLRSQKCPGNLPTNGLLSSTMRNASRGGITALRINRFTWF